MGWFRHLEERFESFAHEVRTDVAKVGHEIVRGAEDLLQAGRAAAAAVVRDAPGIVEKSLKDSYEQLIGNDLKVLRDPHATVFAKADAAFDLASTFAMPLEKIPLMVGEVTLKNLIHEGESKAIVAALGSLAQSGDLPALLGVESTLLAEDPGSRKLMEAAGIDLATATKTLAAVRAAVAAGKDLPVSVRAAVTDIAGAIGGAGSLKTRVASLHSAFADLATISSDLGGLDAGVTAVVAPSAAAATAATTDRDLARDTLAKISPDDVARIRRGGRAEVGMPHLEATPWDGRGQIGSVTSVIGSRVEQYTGKGWTTYDAAQLAPLQAQLAANQASGDPTLVTKISPGDELRVGANGSLDLVPRDPQHPEMKPVSVAPGGASQNLEPSTLHRS